MSITREVCQNFFDFKLELNQGHGIIPSLYDLIYRKQKEDPSYFQCLERRICREIYSCNNLEDSIRLLHATFHNIRANSSELRKETNWQCVAHLFYSVDKIDNHARIILTVNDYEKFKENTIDLLCKKIVQEYGNTMTNEKWYTLVVTENHKAISPEKNGQQSTKNDTHHKKDSFDYLAYLMGIFTAYMFNKL